MQDDGHAGESLLRHALGIEPYLRRSIQRKVGRQNTEDVIQAVFESLLVRGPAIEEVASPTAYTFEVADRAISNFMVDRPGHDSIHSNPSAEDTEDLKAALVRTSLSVEELRIQEVQQLILTMSAMSKGMRDAFFMRRVERLSVPEIAHRLNLSVPTVSRRLSKAVLFLARQMSDRIPEPQPPGSRLYDLSQELIAPTGKIITDVTPKLIVASAAIAERLKSCPQDVHRLTPRQFEELIGELLTDMRQGRVELTRFTRDGGRDLLAYIDLDVGRLLCLIEVKKYRPDRPVGIELVRSLYGVVCDEDASHGTLITTSSFGSDARKFEARHRYRLSLRDYTHVIEWIRRYRTRKH